MEYSDLALTTERTNHTTSQPLTCWGVSKKNNLTCCGVSHLCEKQYGPPPISTKHDGPPSKKKHDEPRASHYIAQSSACLRTKGAMKRWVVGPEGLVGPVQELVPNI